MPTPTPFATTFTVNSSDDVNDGTCNGAHCSLREAINAANVASTLDTIAFAIGSGAVTIAPTSALPTITQPVIIDATTQPGYVSGPIVEIRGDSAGGGVDGLTVTAGGSTIKGFTINRFGGHGIKLTGAGGNTIKTCNIGRDLLAAVQPNAGDGIFVGTAGNFIGGGVTDAEANVISGNLSNGVEISGVGASGNVITNSAIGTNGGLTNLDQGNTLDGVLIFGAPGNTVYYNVISGNESDGIEITGVTASANIVRGNAIGTDRYGTIDLGNTQHGVRILGAPSNSIGLSATTGNGNLISGNSIDGIRVEGAASAGNTIKGNYIGTNLAGTAGLGNTYGVWVESGASGTVIGGTTPTDRNVISGHSAPGDGIVHRPERRHGHADHRQLHRHQRRGDGRDRKHVWHKRPEIHCDRRYGARRAQRHLRERLRNRPVQCERGYDPGELYWHNVQRARGASQRQLRHCHRPRRPHDRRLNARRHAT